MVSYISFFLMHSLVAVQGVQGQTSREPQSTPFLFCIRHVITTCGMYWSIPRKSERPMAPLDNWLRLASPDFFRRGLQRLSARFNHSSIPTISTFQDLPCTSHESSLPRTHKSESELTLTRYHFQRIPPPGFRPISFHRGAFVLISGVEIEKCATITRAYARV